MRNNNLAEISLKRILVLCEGKTEVIYLNGFKSKDLYRRVLQGLIIEQPKNHDPLGLVNEAKKRIQQNRKYPYDSVWVVFDKDTHANVRSALKEAREYKIEINVAFTVICFEFWILLHFERTRRYFSNCAELIKYIEMNWYTEYSKSGNFYPALEKRVIAALENSEWLHNQNRIDIENGKHLDTLQAYTSFDKLLNSLIELTKR